MNTRNLLWPLIGASAIAGVDQAVKVVILSVQPQITAIPGFFAIALAFNTGAAFSLFGQFPRMLTVLGILIVALLIGYYWQRAEPASRGEQAGLALVIGGAVGNLMDQLRLGYVVDYLDFFVGDYHWPTFNLADASIVIGLVYLALVSAQDSGAPRPNATQLLSLLTGATALAWLAITPAATAHSILVVSAEPDTLAYRLSALQPGQYRATGKIPSADELELVGAGSRLDTERYQPARLKDLAAVAPAPDRTRVLTNVAIRARVRYEGQFRPLPEDSREHIRVWAETMSVPEAPRAFHQEVKLSEDGVEYWVPVQDVLWGGLRGELQDGDEIEVFVVHIGRSEGRPIFLLNGFSH